MMITFKKLLAMLVFSCWMILLPGCSDKAKSGHENVNDSNDSSKHRYISIHNLENMPVRVPFSGELTPWKKAQLMVPFKSRIIASLAEPGLRVKKNDLLISLWQYTQSVEYTPLNLLAPFDGEITYYQFHVGDEVPANQPLLTLHNYDYYTITIPAGEGHFKILKKWAKAFIQTADSVKEGYILDISIPRREVVIRFPGKIFEKTNSKMVEGYIEAGMVSGSFIANHIFKKSNSLRIIVDPHIEIQLDRLGISDSLAFIYPQIPEQTRAELVSQTSLN